MAAKFYTSIDSSSVGILERFILKEGKTIEQKTRTLVFSVKMWETRPKGDNELAEAITDFCLKTFAVRLPTASFFLRMLAPEKFGTIDFRSVNALKTLGFKFKSLPPKNLEKEIALKQFDGADYLQYNELITEIGKHYQIPWELGGVRHMTPSEVDMALYTYNKQSRKRTTLTDPSTKTAIDAKKIQRIMLIVEELVRGTRTGPDWVQTAGEHFLRTMKRYAADNDLPSMFEYCTRLATGRRGKTIAKWLEKGGKPSIESEYKKIRAICEGQEE
jgi:hypothetical protein